MIITSYYDSINVLNIMSKGKRYTYYYINPYLYRLIKKLISKKVYGKVWQILKSHSRGDLHD
jgi:hypothetical protein